MIVLGSASLILLIFVILGFALSSGLTRSSGSCPERFLLAPALGIALLVVLSTLISRLDVPLDVAATFLVSALVGLALAVLYLQRHHLSHPAPIWPLAGVAGGLALLAIPGILTKSSWFGYANGDAAYYLFGATRLRYFGFSSPGSGAARRLYETGTDYTIATYFSQVEGGARSGAETLLALMSAALQVDALSTYMPLMLAVAVSLGMASMAIVRQFTTSGPVLFLVGFVVVAGAQAMYAVHNQLLAQVLGLSMAVCIVVLTQHLVQQPRDTSQKAPQLGTEAFGEGPSPLVRGLRVMRKEAIPWILTGGLTLVALVLTYPEVLPFVSLALVLNGAVLVLKRKHGALWYWCCLGMVAILTAVVLTLLGSLSTSLRFMMSEASAGRSRGASGDITLFPDYLVSSGPAAFWGFHPFFAPSMSLRVNVVLLLISLGLLIIAVFVAVNWSLRGLLAAWLALLMLMALLFFVLQGNGFPAFKLVMWLQPFIWPVLGIAIGCLNKKRVQLGLLGALTFLILTQIGTMNVYTSRSLAGATGSLSQAPQLTPEVLANIQYVLKQARTSSSTVVFESDNAFMRQLVALLARGQVVRFGAHATPYPGSVSDVPQQTAQFGPYQISFPSSALESNGPEAMTRVKLKVPSFSVINGGRINNVSLERFGAGEPELTFVPSSVGGTPDLDLITASYFTPEKDPIWEGELQAFRKLALFRIDNFQPGLHIHASVTGTFSPQHEFGLHPVSIWGSRLTKLHFVGAGSGSLTSQREIAPLWIQGQPFVLIDFGLEPARQPQVNSSIPSLWNPHLIRDPRSVSTYVRELTLKTQNDFVRESAIPTSTVTPELLKMGSLSYSGIFEDGWASTNWFVNIHAPLEAKSIHLQGVPATGLPRGLLRYGCESQSKRVVKIAADKPIDLTLPLVAPRCHLRVQFEPSEGQPFNSPRVLLLQSLYWESGP